MSNNALDKWRQKLNHLQTEKAIAANAAQKFELNEQIQECEKEIQKLEARQSISNSESRKNKPKNPIPLWGWGVGVMNNNLGKHNSQSGPASNQGTTSSDPNQGTISEPQTTSEPPPGTASKDWCEGLKKQADLAMNHNPPDLRYVDDVKQKMESQTPKCSSLGVSLP